MTMTDEHTPSTAALVPQVVAGGQTLVRPIAGEDEIVDAFNAYQHLCERLLVPADHQSISGKQFRKKSAWRKLAVAMGVSTEIVDRQYEREGRRIVRAEIVVRATAPNGRSWEGLGACDLGEKCCVQPCSKKRYDNHKCCPADCTGAVHFSNPQHDLPATAATRATNRACADLFGFGEVSAEEIIDRGENEPTSRGDWYVDNGWRAKRDHDAALDELVEQLRTLDETVRAGIKAWARAQEPAIDFTQSLTADEYERVDKLRTMIVDGKATVTADGDVQLVDEQPETAAETPQSDPAPQTAAEPQRSADAKSGADPAEFDESTVRCPVCVAATGTIDTECWGCEGSGVIVQSMAGDVEKVLATEQSAPAKPACGVCGSDRTTLVTVAGVDRCQDGSGCKRRAAQRATG